METYPLNALAERLECDRSTMVKALRGVKADEVKKGNRPTWRVGTASKALVAYKQKIAEERERRKKKYYGSRGAILALVDEIEAAFNELDRQFESLKAEADLEKRRALSLEMKVGMTINSIEELWKAINEMDEEMGVLMQIVADKLVGDARSHLIDLLDLWDGVDEIYAEIDAERRNKKVR
jgi:hypothetical protein